MNSTQLLVCLYMYVSDEFCVLMLVYSCCMFVKADGLLAGGMFAPRLIIERTYTCEHGITARRR